MHASVVLSAAAHGPLVGNSRLRRKIRGLVRTRVRYLSLMKASQSVRSETLLLRPPQRNVFRRRTQIALMVSAIVLRSSSSRWLFRWASIAIWLNGSVKIRECCRALDVSPLKPDQCSKRAVAFLFGVCPWARRISVDASTPERSATCFQFSDLSDFVRHNFCKSTFAPISGCVIEFAVLLAFHKAQRSRVQPIL